MATRPGAKAERVLVVKCEKDKHWIVLQSFRLQETPASATEDLNRCILPADSDIYLLIQHEKGGKATAESKPKNVSNLSNSKAPYKKCQKVRRAADLTAAWEHSSCLKLTQSRCTEYEKASPAQLCLYQHLSPQTSPGPAPETGYLKPDPAPRHTERGPAVLSHAVWGCPHV